MKHKHSEVVGLGDDLLVPTKDCVAPKCLCSGDHSDMAKGTALVGSLGIHLSVQLKCSWAWRKADTFALKSSFFSSV